METVERTDAPIYDSLIAELGDVLGDARRTAEEAHQEAAAAVSWGRRPAGDER